MKKYLLQLILLISVLLCLTVFASAAEVVDSGTCGADLTWTLTDDGVLSIEGTGAMYNYSYYSNHSNAPWYANRSSIQTVQIGNSVTTIGNYAFYGCSSLTAVTIPDGVTTIGNSAFYGCSSLTTVTIPDSVTTIGNYAFSSCSRLTAVAGGDSVTTIGDYAFSSCRSLTTVTIPDSVTSIGVYAFQYCSSLTAVTIGDSVTSIGEGAFYSCYSLTAVTIPDSVTTIGEDAFFDCSRLTAVTIPDSVITIGDRAFYYCSNLTTVTIGGGVTKIGNEAFYYCKKLATVTFLGHAPTIGPYTFEYVTATCYYPAADTTWTASVQKNYGGTLTWKACVGSGICGDHLTWILTGDGMLTIEGNGAMYDYAAGTAPWYENRSTIQTLKLSSKASSIGNYAFYDCGGLTEVSVPDSVTAIGDGAFASCGSLTAITVSGKNTAYSTVDGVLFSKDQTTLLCYPAGIAAAPYNIPETVTAIGISAFSGSSLTEVTIPVNVTAVGAAAFSGCGSLTKVSFEGNAPAIGENAFADVTATCWYPAIVPTWTTDAMQNYGGNLTWERYGAEIFSIAGTTMTLGNDLAMNFMILATDVTGEGWYAEILHGDKLTTVPQSQWEVSGDYLRIVYRGMAAKEMIDELVVTIYDANGFAVSEPRIDSARAYAMRMFGWSSKFDTVLADMLNYGAAAQAQFNYKTDDPANSLMTDAQKAKASQTVTMTDIRTTHPLYQGTTLELESNIVLNFHFARELIGRTAVVTYTNHYGTAKQIEVPVAADGGMGKVSVDQLVIADSRVPVTVTIDGITVTDSVESYCARMQGYLALGEPLMKFATSAKAYFG